MSVTHRARGRESTSAAATSWPVARLQVANRIEADVVWMDERPLNPSRMYLLKHNARTVAAEVDRGLTLNEIGKVVITTTRPLLFDPYATQPRDRQLHPDRFGDQLHGRRRDDHRGRRARCRGMARDRPPPNGLPPRPAPRPNEADAVEAVRRVLEEVLV